MLTIRHIEASGHEHITPALEVGYQPAHAGGPNTPPIVFAHGVPGPDAGARLHGTIQYGDGKVYVMNEHGQTVVVYDLSRSGDPG